MIINIDDNTLKVASSEIKALRQRAQIAESRLQIYDDMMLIFKTQPSSGLLRSASEDVVWEIDRIVREAEKART